MKELVDQLHQLLQEKSELPYDIDAIAKLHSERFGGQPPRGCMIHEGLRLLRQRHRLTCRIEGGKPYLVLDNPNAPDEGEQP